MKTTRSYRAFILQILPFICIAALLAGWCKQRADLDLIKKECGRLREQNAELMKNRTPSRAESSKLAPVPDQAQTEVSRLVQDPAPVKSDARIPKVDPAKLALTATEVKSIAGGLVTAMRFHSCSTGQIGLVALTIRMPRNVNARILDVKPVGSATYSEDSKEVSGDGKFAFYQGSVGAETNVEFSLSVSGAATVDVIGTCGIGAFKLDIQPSGANVRGK